MRLPTLLLLALPASLAWADGSLWQALQQEPNLVVLMRHAQSGGGHPLTWDESGACKGESLLTRKGRADARAIGEAFSARGVRPSVISSPMCRCSETAKLAFGPEMATDPELREVASADSARMQTFEDRARALLVERRGTAPVVFVSHRPNVDRLTMELLDDGDLLVGRIDERGEIEVLGKIVR